MFTLTIKHNSKTLVQVFNLTQENAPVVAQKIAQIFTDLGYTNLNTYLTQKL